MIHHPPSFLWHKGEAHQTCPIILVTEEAFKKHAWDARSQRWFKTKRFMAKKGEVCLVPGADGALSQVVVGIDPKDYWAIGHVPSSLPEGNYVLEGIDETSWVDHALVWHLGCYEYNVYKTSGVREEPWPNLHVPSGVSSAMLEDIEAWVKSYTLVRDLINAPAEDLNPQTLAEQIVLAVKPFDVDVNIIEGDALLEQNFPTIHAVGRAAKIAPRLIEVQWGDANDPAITLVGKGVCFDTGGLDLKTAMGMRQMKKDMGGAAHAMGMALYLMQTKQKVRGRLLIPAVENAIGSGAYRPGDVIKTRKGICVEVDNTDAEGRLILCDALTYACESPMDLLVDFSTLTGAARVAMGPDIPAFFTKDHEMIHQLWQLGEKHQDPIWPLPLYEPYQSFLKSDVADCLNSAAIGYGGAITAALYLSKFVSDQQPWVHFDLMAANTRALPGRPKGGEAQGLRALFAYIQTHHLG